MDLPGMRVYRPEITRLWLNADNPDHCDLARVLSNVDLFRALERSPDDPGESERYFVVASKLNDALVYFFEDIARLAPSEQPKLRP
jgi:hypothetical protein